MLRIVHCRGRNAFSIAIETRRQCTDLLMYCFSFRISIEKSFYFTTVTVYGNLNIVIWRYLDNVFYKVRMFSNEIKIPRLFSVSKLRNCVTQLTDSHITRIIWLLPLKENYIHVGWKKWLYSILKRLFRLLSLENQKEHKNVCTSSQTSFNLIKWIAN